MFALRRPQHNGSTPRGTPEIYQFLLLWTNIVTDMLTWYEPIDGCFQFIHKFQHFLVELVWIIKLKALIVLVIVQFTQPACDLK